MRPSLVTAFCLVASGCGGESHTRDAGTDALVDSTVVDAPIDSGVDTMDAGEDTFVDSDVDTLVVDSCVPSCGERTCGPDFCGGLCSGNVCLPGAESFEDYTVRTTSIMEGEEFASGLKVENPDPRAAGTNVAAVVLCPRSGFYGYGCEEGTVPDGTAFFGFADDDEVVFEFPGRVARVQMNIATAIPLMRASVRGTSRSGALVFSETIDLSHFDGWPEAVFEFEDPERRLFRLSVQPIYVEGPGPLLVDDVVWE